MPLTLVLGPANSAKAGEVLGAFSALAPRGAILVVPTAATPCHYRHELAAQGTVLGTVLTFAGLAGRDRPPRQYTARRACRPASARRFSRRALEAPGSSCWRSPPRRRASARRRAS